MWVVNGEDLVESLDGDLDIFLIGFVLKGFMMEWGILRSLVFKFKLIIFVLVFEFGSIFVLDGCLSLLFFDVWVFLCLILLSFMLFRGIWEFFGRVVILFRLILVILLVLLDELFKCINVLWEGVVKLWLIVGLVLVFNFCWF